MALDTRTKRAGAVHVGCPWRGVLPVGDGTIDQGDRQMTVFMYPGILAAAGAVAAGIVTATFAAAQPDWLVIPRQPQPTFSPTQPEPLIKMDT